MAKAHEERLLTRDFMLLFGAHFVQAFGYASLVLFPVYLDHLGASRAEIGSIMAVAAIGSLSLRPVVAWALDSIGRKPVLIAGTVILVVAMVLIGWVDHAGGMAYVSRFLFGIAAGALFPGYFALAADIVPEGRRTEGLAVFGLGGLIPLAFNGLVQQVGIEPAQLGLFFPMIGIFILLSLVMLAPIKERPREKLSQSRGLRTILREMGVAPLWPVWFSTIIFSLLVSVFMTFATVCAEKRMISDPASLWITYAAGAAMVRLLGARLPDRIGTHNMVAPSIGIYILGLVVTAQAMTTHEFLLGGFLAGIGHGYCFPVLTSQMMGRVRLDLRGAGMATFTALWEIVSLFITPLFGLLADEEGDAFMFLFAASIAAVGLLLWVLVEHLWGASPTQDDQAKEPT
jgi:MFS family permease